MSVNAKRVPEALPDDVPDVVEALDIAHMLFDKGDIAEAARFVRRASDAANKASRLIALARAADELEAQSVPPPAMSETRLSRPPIASPSKPPPLPQRKPSASPPPLPAKASSSKPPPPKPASNPTMPAAKVPSSAPRIAAGAAKALENRMRVCVRISVRDGSLLVVRPLADGETAPAGTRSAWLVMDGAEELAAGGSAAR